MRKCVKYNFDFYSHVKHVNPLRALITFAASVRPPPPFLQCNQVTSQPASGGGGGSGGDGSTPSQKTQSSAPKVRKSVSSRIHEAVKAIALCHNVTPVYESHAGVNGETELVEADQDFSDDNRTYQASSPDEVSERHDSKASAAASSVWAESVDRNTHTHLSIYLSIYLVYMCV